MTWGRVLLWLVLGASLFANAVVLGLYLRAGPMADRDGALRSAWADLPVEMRGDLRAALRDNRGELRQLVADLRAARAEVMAAVRARPHDRDAVVAAQAKVRVATDALVVSAQLLMLEAFDRSAGAATTGGP
jgi:uncharacterized membrane protein